MQSPIDQQQRLAALNPERSFIVQAPAGSGKTELLTQRYLTLLARAQEPEEIIAITFTRKAAAEMRARILMALEKAQQDTPTDLNPQSLELALAVLAHDKIRHWHLLEHPSRLRIQTIDALCASLTRQMPILSGLGAQPTISDDPNTLYRLAARTVLASLENDVPWRTPLIDLLLHLDNDQAKIEQLFSMMLARRDQWLPHVLRPMTLLDQRHILEQGLQNAIRDQLLQLKNSIPQHLIPELLALLHFAKFIDQSQLPNTEPNDIHAWLKISDFLLTEKDEWRKEANKKIGIPAPSSTNNKEEKAQLTEIKIRYKELVNNLNQYETFRINLKDLRLLPSANYSDQQWKIITALLELLPVLVAELHLLFQEHGVVDYSEIASSALKALGDPEIPTDLALRLDYRIQHILVDEFQDTSISQWRLLEQLTAGWQPDDGRTLFLVGDPMQSIYRFRKAEVGLFLQARAHGIGAIYLEPLTLSVNFRSTSSIVDWINTTFKSLLPTQENISAGAVSYSPSVAQNEITSNSAPAVNLHALSISNTDAESKKIISIIQQTLQQEPQNHIAILVRARTHLLEILPALQKAGINYRAIEIEALSERPIINDLMALTRALLHPADRIAWLALLRAPWCGLTLQDLHTIVGPTPHTTLWDRLQLIDELSLTPDGRKYLDRILPILTIAINNRRRTTLAHWIEGTWQALGGPACITAETELNDAQAFFKLLASLEMSGDIVDLTLLENKLAQLYSKPSTQTDVYVDVMTIHKSKGLEFDTVILPGLQRTSSNDEAQLLLAMERPTSHGTTDLLLAPIKSTMDESDSIYNYLCSEEKKRADYEATRLLYVAATRAKKSLHLIASFNEQSERLPNKNSLLAKLWPVLANDFSTNLEKNNNTISVDHNISIEQPLLRRLTNNWQLPITASNITPTFTREKPLSHDKNIPPLWRDDPSRIIGTVVHRLLQQICLDGTEKWSNEIITARQAHIASLLVQTGITENNLTTSLTTVQRALTKTLQDPRGLWILNNQHTASQVEYPLTAILNNKTFNIIIDRTFIDEHGTRWIIDYKTTNYTGEDLANFLATEQELHHPQLEQYAKVMQLAGPHPIKLGLYFPLLGAWQEWVPPRKIYKPRTRR